MSALVPLLVLAGLLLGPAATATAAVSAPSAARQAPAAAALPRGPLLAGAGAVTVLRAPESSQVQAVTGNKKKKKKSKKKGGLFKSLLIVVLLVIVVIAIVFGVRMFLRRRSS
ncbi:hypothetical protein [Streptomyces sp. NPDC002104]